MNTRKLFCDLVRGIAESGEWAGSASTRSGQSCVSPYFRQDEKLRAVCVNATTGSRELPDVDAPTDEDLQAIHDMAIKAGILTKPISMKDLIDREFIPTDIKAAKIDVGR